LRRGVRVPSLSDTFWAALPGAGVGAAVEAAAGAGAGDLAAGSPAVLFASAEVAVSGGACGADDEGGSVLSPASNINRT
jgi:hypothetical protein